MPLARGILSKHIQDSSTLNVDDRNGQFVFEQGVLN
jgi:hypothetical protein